MTIHLMITTLIFTYSHTTLGMLLATRTSSLRRTRGIMRDFHSSKSILHSSYYEKSTPDFATRQLCEKLIIKLKENDEIIKQLLDYKHRNQLIYYPGKPYPVERHIIIAKMKESTALFQQLERTTKSWDERD